MTEFTPYSALSGGILIGIAAVILLAALGRMAGISGILGGLLPAADDWRWRAAFLLGLIGGAWLFAVAFGATAPRTEFPRGLLVLAGIAVGYGTRIGAGCTSGHGVCGLGRRSPRSLVAVAVFMLVAVATTFVTRHLLGVGA